MSVFWQVVAGLIPSVGVGLLFYLAMRYIVRADRNERIASDRLAAEQEMKDALTADERPSD